MSAASLVPDSAVERMVRRERDDRRRDLVLAVATPAILLATWELASRSGVLDSRIFPPPSRIAETAASLVSSGMLLNDLRASVLRIAAGYTLGAIAGILAGLLMGYFRPARAALEPTFTALYAVPKIAILPLLLLIFGLGEQTKILIVAIPTFFVMEISTMDGVKALDPRLVEAGRAYGAQGRKLFRHVLLPGVAASVFTGLRVAAGLSIVVIIAAEFVAANEGLGYLIWNSWQLFQPERMFVGLVVVALLGTVVTGLLALVERALLPWRRESSWSRTDY